MFDILAWGLNAGKPGRRTHIRVLRAAEGKPWRPMDSLTSDDAASVSQVGCDGNVIRLQTNCIGKIYSQFSEARYVWRFTFLPLTVSFFRMRFR